MDGRDNFHPTRDRRFTRAVYGGTTGKLSVLREIVAAYQPETSPYQVYFGEIHGHSELSDGGGSPDDYFSMILLNIWLVTAFFAVRQTSEPWLIAFFGTTTFFLIYVPFSKISHYLLWPFIRYYQGKHFGHRGVYPKKMVANNGLRQTQSA